MTVLFGCILLLAHFATLFSYLNIILAVITQIDIKTSNPAVACTNLHTIFVLLTIHLLERLCKRNFPAFLRRKKTKIKSVIPFFLVTLYFLLIRSGVEVNPGPTSQFCDIFAHSKRNITLAHLNIQNLLSRNGTKLDEISLLLEQSAQSPLVLGLSETWLSKYNSTSVITFENYHQPFRKDRSIKIKGRYQKGGGILVYVSKLLRAKRRNDLESKVETLWIEIFGNNVPHLLVCNFYRPPQSTQKNFFEEFESQIEKAKEYGLPIFLLGDLNIDILNKTNPYLAEIDRLQKSFNLVQLISTPTRVTNSSSTLIDHIYCSNLNNVTEAKNHACPISDHSIIYCRISSTMVLNNKPTCTRFCRNYKKISNDDLIMFFSNVCWNQFYAQKDINKKWVWFHNLLIIARDRLAPVKLVRTQNQRGAQWETDEVRILRKKCNRALLKWKKSRGLEEKLAFLSERQKFEKEKMEAKSLFYKHKCMAAKNSKNRWRVINRLLGRTTRFPNCETLVYDGKTINKHSDIANVFNTFFTRVGGPTLERKNLDLSEILASCSLDGFRFHTISQHSVLKLLNTLNVSKPAGPDELPPEFLKKIAIYIYQPLTHLFNQCITENSIPDKWKLAYVTPIYKKGNSSDPSNYRPISVTSATSKIFEKIICTQLFKYLESNNLLTDNQFGYRRNLCTEDAIVKLVEDTKSALNQKKHTAVVFLDLSKAFDTVQHDILLQYLSKLKLSPNAVSLMSNYLSDRRQKVRLSNHYSDWLPLTAGVPQGSLLGPLLFLIYVNDISRNIINSKIISYADDTALYFSSEDKEDLISNVNRDLHKLLENLDSLSLKVNVSKTKFLLITKCNAKDFPSIKINKEALDPADEVNYLGVTIDKNLSFRSQIQKVINRIATANSAISYISKLVNKSTRLLLYHSLVNSQLYCSTVWQYCTDSASYQRFLRQQNWSLRIIENRHHRQGVQDLKSGGNYVPFEVFLALNSVKLIHKLIILDKLQSYNLQLAPRHKESFGIQLQNCRINGFRYSLQHKGAMIWNSLDPPIRIIKSPFIFKEKARKFLLERYIQDSVSIWCT